MSSHSTRRLVQGAIHSGLGMRSTILAMTVITGLGLILAARVTAQTFTTLHSFTATNGVSGINGDGANPFAGLTISGNTLYGTAAYGGSSGYGTVFALNTDGTGFTTLHTFTAGFGAFPSVTNSDGAFPYLGLFLSGDTLYGTADSGGTWGNGTVFAVKTDGTGFMILYTFTARDHIARTNSDGAAPSGVILSGNTLYGTAFHGGSSGNGTVFSLSFAPQLTITPSGAYVILTWPTNYVGFDYTGFILQQTTNLVSPAVWTTVSPGPAVVNEQNTIINLISAAEQFYRLIPQAQQNGNCRSNLDCPDPRCYECFEGICRPRPGCRQE